MALTVYILSIAYALFICWCIFGWIRLPEIKSSHKSNKGIFVSVIIPARNEELNIVHCLEDFLLQDFPSHSFELIVINDHSTDATAAVIEKFIASHPGLKIKFIDLVSGGESKLYKKYAITKGIEAAAGTLIITTDADCRRGQEWLSAIVDFYSRNNPSLISAPVFFENEKTWIEKIQSLEFLGLVAIGAAGIRNRVPFLCNGANLAFPKSIFDEVEGYDAKKNSASGDDTQLMRKIIPGGKEKILFLKSNAAAVTTSAKKSVSELLEQRQRWASKIPFHMTLFTLLIALVAFFLHLGLLVIALMAFVTGNVSVLLIPLMIKMVPEFILLFLVCSFARKSNLLYLFLPAQIIYPIYVSFVGITSMFGTHQWKGRNQ
jgi:cellulose synthase/poly-beta-1,6-N-acetylglucosamine synthase-like glycosyltransferase